LTVEQPKRPNFRYRHLWLIAALTLTPVIGCCGGYILSFPIQIWLAQRQLVDGIMSTTYPTVIVEKVDQFQYDPPIGHRVSLRTEITFSTSDSFDKVKQWYATQPDFRLCSDARYNASSMYLTECWLTQSKSTTTNTTYTVDYAKEIEFQW